METDKTAKNTKQVQIRYMLKYNEEMKIYTAYCPVMKPVRFSGKDKERVRLLVREGIEMYLKHHPDVLAQLKEEQEYVYA